MFEYAKKDRGMTGGNCVPSPNKIAKAIVPCLLMLLGFENALAAYSPFEVRRIQDLVGQYTIQSVAEISQGVDIGVTDASTSNMSAIRSAIERMGISPDAVSFHHESAIRDNPWYIDYAQDKGGSGDESLPLYLLGGLAALSAAGALVARKRRSARGTGGRFNSRTRR